MDEDIEEMRKYKEPSLTKQFVEAIVIVLFMLFFYNAGKAQERNARYESNVYSGGDELW